MKASNTSPKPPAVTDLKFCQRDYLVNLLGLIYYHSPWVAETLYDDYLVNTTNEISSIRDLFNIMKRIVDCSTNEQKNTLLCAYPDLCKKVSDLSQSSQEEQSRAGLQSLTEDERTTILSINKTYREKFGFPFILAVRNATKYTVLSAIKARVNNSMEVEFAAALAQVHKIAWMRLLGTFTINNRKGFLTCHVLDTATRRPGMSINFLLKIIEKQFIE